MTLKLSKTTLKSPLVLLSGTVSPQILSFLRPDSIGLVVLKTITLKPKEPNPEPRMWDLGFGVLNSIGLFNLGVDNFISKELPKYLELGFDYGISISGFSRDEFIEVARRVSQSVRDIENIKALELNFSCPNVEKGGIQFASQPEEINYLTSEVTRNFNGEVWVKISPVYDVLEQVNAAIDGGATGIVVANTFPSTAFDRSLRNVLGAGSGGLSGPALLPINLLNVKKASSIKTLIIASGGVDSFHAFKSYIAAGANLVGIGTALFRNPLLPEHLIEELKSEMKSLNVGSFSEYLITVRRKEEEK
ncbi:MAG: hypothetical protein N2440_06350 [Actinobacteria bacterium]|nr:hypothetical protein [Actinomycetota bacterium]